MTIDTQRLRELAEMTPEQNTDYERLKQAAASVWFAGNMYIGPSMRELMRFLGEYKRLSPEYEQHLEMVNEPAPSVPVLTVECEPDYWSGGHYHEGTMPYIDPTAVWKLPIGTELYTSPPANNQSEQHLEMVNAPEQSVTDEQLQAAFDRGLKAGNEQSVAQQIEIHKLHDSLAAPQPEPLSDERIFKLFLEKAVDRGTAGIYDFARAIEREILG